MRAFVRDIITEERLINNEKHRENVKRRVEETIMNPDSDYAEFIVKTVAERLGFTIEDLKGKRRYPRIVEARYMAISIISDNTNFRDYSSVFVGRDRTTYYHAIETLESLLIHNRTTKIFEELKKSCSLEAYRIAESVDNKA